MLAIDSLNFLESLFYFVTAVMIAAAVASLVVIVLWKTVKTICIDIIEIAIRWVMYKQDARLRRILIQQYIDNFDAGLTVKFPALPPSQQMIVNKENRGGL